MLRRLELQVERLDRRRHGKVVQGHVDEAGVAPCGERRRAVRDVLPVGPTRLVEVHVRVDAAGEDMHAGTVDLICLSREVRPDLGDAAVLDPDIRRLDTARGDHGPTANDHGRASSARNRPRTSIATDTSAAVTDSAGLWLTPPLQRTKSIPTPVSADIATASCPAPLVRASGCCFASLTALVSSDTNVGSHCTAAFSLRERISTASLRRLASSRARARSASHAAVLMRSS